MAAANMQPIYDRLNAVAGYNPLTAETFGDWAMEAGDIVRVIRGEDAYDVPVHSSTLIWHGQQRMNIDATGKKERDSIAKASAQKYGRGGAAVRGSQSMYQYFESENQSLRSEFEMSYESLRVTFENELDSTRSEFQMTAESLRIQFENELDSTRSEFQMTADSLRISFENEIASTRAEISVQSDRISLVVEGSGPSATVKRASIIAAVTDVNGKLDSSITMNADHVYIGSGSSASTVDVVVNGKLTTTDLSAQIASLGLVEVQRLSTTNDIAAGSVYGQNIYISGATAQADPFSIKGFIKEVHIDGPTSNVYKLQYKTYNDSEWQDAGSFSRATSLSSGWSSGNFPLTITATPQGNEYVVGFSGNPNVKLGLTTSGTPTQHTDYKKYIVATINVASYNGETPTTRYSENMTINASAVWDAAEEQYTSLNAFEEMPAGSGTVYYAAGTQKTVYESDSSSGTAYYTAGTPANYYKQSSSGGTTYYRAGTAANYYKQNTTSGTTYYTAGTTVYAISGSALKLKSKSVTPIGSTSISVKKRTASVGGSTLEEFTAYYHDGSNFISMGKHKWYATDSSGTTTYYRAGTAATYYYMDNTGTEYYEKGSGYTVIGGSSIKVDAVASVTPIGTGSITVDGVASVTPISTTSIKVKQTTITPINADNSVRIKTPHSLLYKKS